MAGVKVGSKSHTEFRISISSESCCGWVEGVVGGVPHAHTLNMERHEQLLTVQNSAYFDQFPSLILQQTACYSQ